MYSETPLIIGHTSYGAKRGDFVPGVLDFCPHVLTVRMDTYKQTVDFGTNASRLTPQVTTVAFSWHHIYLKYFPIIIISGIMHLLFLFCAFFMLISCIGTYYSSQRSKDAEHE